MTKAVVDDIRKWVEKVVIAWNLCPFARKEFFSDRIRYHCAEAGSEEELLLELAQELLHLQAHPEIETTLLIHPYVLKDFEDYNQFLDYAEGLLEQLDLVGVFQLASFHPDYCFAGSEPDDPTNYSNRSPYPLLHLLRETSMTRAVESHSDVNRIPEDNSELLAEMGLDQLRGRWANLFGP